MSQSSPQLRDVIRQFGPALRRQHGGTLSSAQETVLAMLGDCRTEKLGGHLYRCDNCNAERWVFNSCDSRLCPTCLGHKSAEWLEARSRELLPVPYFHVVFTLPKQLRALALGNKEVVYNILLRAVGETLSQVASTPEHLGAKIGFLAVLHTWTQTLLHHPHVHCVVPGGGLSPDRSRWVSCRPNSFLPLEVLSRLFRGKFLAMLEKAAGKNELRFAGSTAPLAEPEAWADFKRQMRGKKWVVYCKPPFGSPEQVLKYLARYTHRVAISNSRILSVTKEQVTFRYRDHKRNLYRTMTLDGVEFLRRFLLHILPKSFMRIRFYGLLANRYRKDNLAQCRALLGAAEPAVTAGAAAELDPEADEAADTETREPRRCPNCKIGFLRYVAELPPIDHLRRRRRPPPLLRYHRTSPHQPDT